MIPYGYDTAIQLLFFNLFSLNISICQAFISLRPLIHMILYIVTTKPKDNISDVIMIKITE